mgnify:CR=1 FL=1
MNNDLQQPVSLILVDDHALYRMGIRAAISRFKCRCKLTVLDEAGSGAEFFALLDNGKIPDLVLLDIWLPDTSGIEIARLLRSHYPAIKIIMLSAEVSEEIINQLLDIGVDGYLSKLARKDDIQQAICNVVAGNQYFGRSVSKMMYDIYVLKKHPFATKKQTSWFSRPAQNDIQLTERELEVIRLLCDGCTVKEIAEKLAISARTVETHKANTLAKLGFSRTADLIKYAIREKIIEI